ncbi:glycosyl hydrolase family 18 protein [Glycomyces xiaoerkulensis]|uniref:glycosyl hydrolase family 18 protein n=1 Tax=Glycomyces xiaoerkulensis TaxID=2038139 RepID=UPI0038CC085C
MTAALAVALSGAIYAVANPFTATAQQTCSAAWDSAAVYNGGDQASHNGNEWRAQWWTQGEEPGTTGEWGVWEDLGPCGDGGGDPTDDPTGDPGGCPADWDASGVYVGGDEVGHNGTKYRAQWWTQGDEPGTADVWEDLGPCSGDGEPTDDPTSDDPTDDPTDDPSDPVDPPTEQYNVAYFTEWGVYGRDYHVKDIATSGSAEELTHIVYAFGNVQDGECRLDDSYAATDKAYTAAESVDGVADDWDQDLRGNFNQLLKLKEMYPHIKVLWSFGGWTYSGGFGEAAQNPSAFADSCYDLLHDPRWDGLFDGIDIDWEYPNACGLSCDDSGTQAYPDLMQALRGEFGGELVTAAITADASSGGKIDAGGYDAAAQYVDFYMVMTYDFFGAWDAQGPTAPHSPLHSYDGIPNADFYGANAISKLKSIGVPADKMLLGFGFYGRGWTGVDQSAPGGSATGAASGTYESGIEDYKVLVDSCPSTGTVAGTAYAHCGDDWWSYDTPATIGQKVDWLNGQGLLGAFSWELSGDTGDGELVSAIHNGLN